MDKLAATLGELRAYQKQAQRIYRQMDKLAAVIEYELVKEAAKIPGAGLLSKLKDSQILGRIKDLVSGAAGKTKEFGKKHWKKLLGVGGAGVAGYGGGRLLGEPEIPPPQIVERIVEEPGWSNLAMLSALLGGGLGGGLLGSYLASDDDED